MNLSHSLTPFELADLQSRVRCVTFQEEPMRPWWVGRCPVIANAVHWIPGVEAAAVYRVKGFLIVVAAWRNPARAGGVAWASADLGVVEEPAREAC